MTTTIQENSKPLKALYLIGWIIALIAIFFIDMDTNQVTKSLMIIFGLLIALIAKVMMWWNHA